MAGTRGEELENETRPGIAVDARGGAVIDPTKNVLDLVRAAISNQDAMRDGLKELLNEKVSSLKEMLKLISDSQVMFQNAQRDAETKRIDQLAQTRQEFQNTIRDMLAESVRTTSNLVSTQLVQIQATFDTRVTKLEAGAFTQAGKQSVADPALSDAMTRLTTGLASVSASQIEQTAKLTAAISAIGTREDKTLGARMGQSQVIAWIIGAAMLMAAIATPLIAFLALRNH